MSTPRDPASTTLAAILAMAQVQNAGSDLAQFACDALRSQKPARVSRGETALNLAMGLRFTIESIDAMHPALAQELRDAVKQCAQTLLLAEVQAAPTRNLTPIDGGRSHG